MNPSSKEVQRLVADANSRASWRLWGPYLAERQWGTVREDYSASGDAWASVPHDHARSKAYRWGEEGLAGLSDIRSRLCLGLALWNGNDPILKERLFGLTNAEGNHGEDVKEVYYYLDATPTHSYLKYLYKYPQRAFPYAQLVDENRRRAKEAPEYELLDTGIFEDDRYFDVFVEYAKASVDDILMRITVHNRGAEAAMLHVLPHLWCRNIWSWRKGITKPELRQTGPGRIYACGVHQSDYELVCENAPVLLFTENETNRRRLYGEALASGFFKDGINDAVVGGRVDTVNPAHTGTKVAAHYVLNLGPSGSAEVRLRLKAVVKSAGAGRTARGGKSKPQGEAFADFDEILTRRRAEADEFYDGLQEGMADPDARWIQRQAFAGMVWSRQFYRYHVHRWLTGDPDQPAPPEERRQGRNRDWSHLNAGDVLSMPDKWEFPWFASWDLAFHCIPQAIIDPEFAKAQLVLLTREWYMHPNGELPAYEWSFSDANPPVHAWATWRVFQMDRKARRLLDPKDPGDLAFLERVFHKLLLNFTWWVNRKDAQGKNIFQGGFLGLDNIGVFDRSAKLPPGVHINQADATSWMAMYSLNLMRIALELACHNPAYGDIASKFFEHFLGIAAAINGVGEDAMGLWDEQDEFYYDQIQLPDQPAIPLKVRSMVGLIPLFAVETLEEELLNRLPHFKERMLWFLEHRPDLAALVSRWHDTGRGDRHLLSLLRGHRMKCLLRRVLDPEEFLSDFGIRSLSKVHEKAPYRFKSNGESFEIGYVPGESRGHLFGGNSNWRGPIWMPVNFLIIESLQRFHHYYGDDFKVEYPTGSGHHATLDQIATDLGRRLSRLFLRDSEGHRPVLAAHPKLSRDPHFSDHILFHEYFHGDTGRGCGASHQTGWTGLITKLLMPRRTLK